MAFNFEEVKQAYERISPYVRKTPLEESFYLNDDSRRYYFKLETMQRVKSFKIRGAMNKMLTLTEEEKQKGVATISSGNHGSCTTVAAVMDFRERVGGKNIALVISGGNIDGDLMVKILNEQRRAF